MRILRWVLAALLLILSASSASAYRSENSPYEGEDYDPVILIGIGSLTWADIDPDVTPALNQFAQRSAVAAMSTRMNSRSACAIDGWLTLGAGDRTSVSSSAQTCPSLPESNGESFSQWGSYIEDNTDNKYDPHLGRLGSLIADNDRLAVGIGRGGVLALADDEGRVTGKPGSMNDYGSLAYNADLVLIDIGVQLGESPREKAAATDHRFAEIIERIQEETPHATVFVASFGGGSSGELNIAMMSRVQGLLGSVETQRPGLIHITDLASELASIVDPDTYSNLTLTETRGAVGVVRDMVGKADANVPAFIPFFTVWGLSWIGLMAYLFYTRTQDRLHPAVHIVGLAIAIVPTTSALVNVVPWWSWPSPTLLLIALTVATSGLAGIGAHLVGRWGRWLPAGLIALINLVFYLGNVATGSTWVMDSILGSPPHLGARYYGMNNMMFAVVAVSSLVVAGVCAAWIKQRHLAALAVLGIGAVTVLIDGHPRWGADFGGPPVLTLAFLLLAWMVLGKALTWWAILAAIVASGLVNIAFLAIDYPEKNRTHLGDFAADVVGGNAWTTIQRKISELLGQWPFFILLAVLIVFALWLWYRYGPRVTLSRERTSLPVWMMVALVIAYLGATFLNDSGVAIVSVGNLVAFPLMISILSLSGKTRNADNILPSVRSLASLDAR